MQIDLKINLNRRWHGNPSATTRQVELRKLREMRNPVLRRQMRIDDIQPIELQRQEDKEKPIPRLSGIVKRGILQNQQRTS